MCIKSFPFSVLMNILQGLKLRWDLSICRGESGGEGLGGDTAAVATAVCLGVRGSQAWKPYHTYCMCEFLILKSEMLHLNTLLWLLFMRWPHSHFSALQMWNIMSRAMLHRVFSLSLACMSKPVSMHSCRGCWYVLLLCVCVCVLWISHRYMSALQHSQGALI